MDSDQVKALAENLSAEEIERAERFRFPTHRARFVAGRGMLRELLADYLGAKPKGLEFAYSSFGKPELRPPADINFNVAHSEARLLVAVARQAVGVDIEVTRPIPDLELLAKQVFSPDELRAWQARSDDTKLMDFVSLWTRKEALLKGMGRGIAHHVKRVSVFFSNADAANVLTDLTKASWSILTEVQPEEIWSVALESEAIRVKRYSF